MTQFSIRIGDGLLFSAAHFITFENGDCESLHGHDFRVKVELFGPLGRGEYIVDFVAAQECLQLLVKALDHGILLPGNHRSLTITMLPAEECQVTFRNRRWIFPRENCRILPIENTTTEKLAEYLGQQFLETFVQKNRFPLTEIHVEVAECGGFSAVCRIPIT